MALFSRRKKSDAAVSQETSEAAEEPRPDETGTPAAAAPSEPTPTVSISVSSFQGLGGPTGAAPTADAARTTPEVNAAPPTAPAPAAPPAPRPLPPAEAPAATESVPGLRDNVLLAEALEAYGAVAEPTSIDLLNVTRQLMQGHVFLRVQGDARTLLSEGKELPLAVLRSGDKQFLLAFSTGAALQANARAAQDQQSSAMGQPIVNVIRHMLAASHAGIILDQSSPAARAVLPRELLERVLKEGDPTFAVKNLLSTPRTPETPGAVAAALVTAPLWVAVGQAPPEVAGGKPRVGIAESQTPDGKRYLEVFSHPLEVLALGRGSQPMPFPIAKLATSLRDHSELTGVVVDPGGPWIRLERDALGPVLELAETV